MSSYMPTIPSISLRPATPSPPTQHPPPQRIDPRKCREVRKRLRSYRVAVTLHGDAVPTSLDSSSPFQAGLSSRGSRSSASASQTYPPAASEASYATSHTDYTVNTVIWSQQDGSSFPDPKKKPLDPVMRTQKALMRYLGKCSRDCRERKVKCSLSHHALRDILDGEHDDQAESDVQWALDYHSETRGVDSNSMPDDNQSIYELGDDDDMMMGQNPPTTQMAVIDNAANQLDMPATPVPMYPSTINEGDLHDAMDEPTHGGIPQYANNTSFQYFDPHHTFPQQQTFNTTRTLRTLPLATEMLVFDSNGSCPYYKCICFSEACQQSFLSLQDILNHTRQHGYIPLRPDPMRLVCPNCFEFYAENSMTGMCWNIECSSKGRLVVNICGELYLAHELARQREYFY